MITIATIEHIRRYIAQITEDSVFSIRELLSFGSRPAVDRAVGRLVQCGSLLRVARGLYIRPSGKPVDFAARQLAEVKARAFGKQVYTCGKEGLSLFWPQEAVEKTVEAVFAVNGSSSSFMSSAGRIYFKQLCPRYLRYGYTHLGLTIRALLHLCKANLDPQLITGLYLHAEGMGLALQWLPAWLADLAWRCNGCRSGLPTDLSNCGKNRERA